MGCRQQQAPAPSSNQRATPSPDGESEAQTSIQAKQVLRPNPMPPSTAPLPTQCNAMDHRIWHRWWLHIVAACLRSCVGMALLHVCVCVACVCVRECVQSCCVCVFVRVCLYGCTVQAVHTCVYAARVLVSVCVHHRVPHPRAVSSTRERERDLRYKVDRHPRSPQDRRKKRPSPQGPANGKARFWVHSRRLRYGRHKCTPLTPLKIRGCSAPIAQAAGACRGPGPRTNGGA